MLYKQKNISSQELFTEYIKTKKTHKYINIRTIQSACNYKIKTYHAGKKQKSEQRSTGQVPRCHPVQDYHTVIPFQHKRSTKQAKHETKNKQKGN